MEAIFEFVNIDKSNSLEALTQKKLDKIENKYDWVVRANVFFKRDENQKPNGYITEIRLSAPGPEIFAESNEDSFEAAIAKSTSDIERQCSKRKSKMSTH
ncbi:HPF/RaiA family ribosome-associated protein [Christiangramia sabulilitoris]|uniref:HPF/RaiA family ribosome-associated protein n=1 Tax=Christiangramia sabulilitoris TaxID=2583991 RepID=A0A550I6N8_9FLAO|nr:HPF/RaiA family ribosome-associated protein [Christiangramia sabulilitoris]TRO66478.1 HPF/RaiA family ribosome-associated protein [Christiangramia sabulilitoris]